MTVTPLRQMAIETRHLSKRFGEVTALDDINLCIARGEFVAIMGASGSGKTTLMNILTCLDTASEGQVILENIMLAQHYHSVVDEAAARAVLAQVGLEHRMTHLPSQLSGGEQQRVCIARALVNEPPVIFADEPTGNLDEENEQRVLDLLTDLHRQGRTIVMVTHNPALGKFADRIVRLQHGKYLGEEMNPHAHA